MLRYFYFRLYSYYSDGGRIPFFSTATVIIIFACFNLLSILDLIFAVIGGIKIELPIFTGANRFLVLLLFFPLYFAFYYIVKKSGYHAVIMDEFKDETSKQKLKSSLGVIIYFIASIILFVFSLWLRQRTRGY